MELSNKNGFFEASPGEPIVLIRAYRDGDEAAFRRLADIYMPLIDSMVSRSYANASVYIEKDDLMQYALIAFSKAAIAYDLEQDKVSFGLYAKICIGNALVSRLRSAQRNHIEVLPMEDIFDMADPDSISDDMIDRENARKLSELIKSTLSDFENDVFRLYALGYSTSEIAEKLGKTEKSVDNAIFRARKKLKTVLNEAHL